MSNISVIIPMFNARNTINRAIRSVFCQTYSGSVEVIVINDGSTDDSLDLVNGIDQIPSNYTLQIISQNNKGVSAARNLGIRIACSDWVCFLDSDDEWLPEKLSSQVKILKSSPEIDFLGCNLYGQEYRFFWKKEKPLMKVKLWELLLKMHPQTSTAIVRKNVLLNVGLYNESMRHAEDGDLWIRICSTHSFWFSTDSLVVYDGGKRGFGGIGLAGNIEKMHDGELFTLRNLLSKKTISVTAYLFFSLYYKIKYLRRKLLIFIKP